MTKTKLFITLLFISFSSVAFSQSLGVNFALGFPQGEFKDNVDKLGYGIGAELILPTVKGSPVEWGANLIFINYGSETRRAPWSYTIPDLTVDVTRQNNLVALNGLIRIGTPTTLLKAYVDLMAGGQYLYTTTSVQSRSGSNQNQDVASDTNLDDWAFSYGGGPGIMFNVYSNETTNVMVDLKVRYLFGTKAEYLTEKDVEIDTQHGKVIYHPRKSKTDMLYAQLGVNISF
ncbi:MAG: hypothetical protein LC102_01550 [Ignavibacteriales bacterium]|nr:MAG: hypothetical protein F9K26_04700 [Ignavibacteriaceae bacterium]MBW7873407.1 hypothetical protein [Ignavibacteria bacterium]MCZ2142098.1 hypothetical protein [Ignavibacteriales bacterium]MBV6444835.1 hypothetical protein [Ignavibacteriaceae bacterium]MBZ0197007.1 hypothetical protein [Ignavibacteriaceae bacterium]